MASRDDASEVWKVARRPRDADFIYCPFLDKDDESACNQNLNVPNGSEHIVKRHFDRAHKDWERYEKKPPSINNQVYMHSDYRKQIFISQLTGDPA